jgi:malate synthase
MTQPFMRAYTQQLVRICHRRGVHAMGGMAAQIPIRGDAARNEVALEKVRADKRREVSDGHDGTWVAHPALVTLAREIFDAGMPGPNQIARQRPECVFSTEALLAVPEGSRTLAGLRRSLRVGVLYLEAWLRGRGCVPLFDVMEDTATAEICRAQIWQWVRHRVSLDDGVEVHPTLVLDLLNEEVRSLPPVEGSRLDDAARLFGDLCTSHHFSEFLTLPAYRWLKE